MKSFWILLTAVLLLAACSQESYLPFINFDSAFDTKTRFEKKISNQCASDRRDFL